MPLEISVMQFGYFAIVRDGERYNFHTDRARTSDPSLGQRDPRTDPEQVYVFVASFFSFRSQVRVRLTYNRLSILARYPARNWFSFPHIRGPSVTRGETRVGHCPSSWTRFSPLVSLRFYPAFDSSACMDLRNRPRRWRCLRRER